MKRYPLLLAMLITIMLVSLIAGCSSSNDGNKEPNSAQPGNSASTDDGSNSPTPNSGNVGATGTPEEVILTVGTLSEEDKIAFEAVAAEFQKKYPHVKFDFAVGSHSHVAVQMAAAGNMPDVFWLWDGYVRNMYDEGLLAPLDEAMARQNVDLGDIPAGMLSYGLFDGHYYFAPRDHSQMVTFVNRTLLENEGFEMPGDDWTWDEFVEISRAVTKRDAAGNVIQSGLALNINSIPNWTAIADGFGGQLFDQAANRMTLSKPETVAAFKNVLDLMKEGVFANEYADEKPDFNAGEAAFFFSVRPATANVVSSAEASGFEWDVLPFPEMPAKRAIGSGTSGYGVNPDSKHLAEATDFAAFLMTYDGHKAFSGNMLGAVPLLKSLQAEDYWREFPEVKGKNVEAFIKYSEANVDRVTDILLKKEAGDQAEVFGNRFSEYMDGEKSLEDILTELDELINGLQNQQ